MNNTERIWIAQRVGLTILGFDLLLFLLLIGLSALRMMDGEEFNEALVLLVPIRGLYSANIVKYLIADNSKKRGSHTSLKGKVIITIIVIHFVAVISVIFFFGLGGDTDIFWLRNSLAFIETFFGVYLSQIIPDLFAIEKMQ